MTEHVLAGLAGSPLPEFGATAPRRGAVCSPRELFQCLVLDPEENIPFFECGFELAASILAATPLPASLGAELERSDPLGAFDRLVSSARRSLEQPSLDLKLDLKVGHGRDELRRAARELAPASLTDGAWLRGAMLANTIETEVGLSLLKQLMLRFGDPGSGEAHAQRYASLLRSLGVHPDSVTHQGLQRSTPSDASYEHALLGLCLGLFPSTFALETVGYDLWMSAVGPCPLLDPLPRSSLPTGVCWRYFDLFDRTSLAANAREAVRRALEEFSAIPGAAARIARGFQAAHQSYQRWLLSLRGSPAPLAGSYTAPREPRALEAFALERYGKLGNPALYHCFANSDCHPTIGLFGQRFVSGVLAKLSHALDTDPRLNSTVPPRYSEAVVAGLVADQHEKNVRARLAASAASGQVSAPPALQHIGPIFDGCWLQGFADVLRAGFEEYGWLFRIYASEHGDGVMEYNHSRIFRKAYSALGPDVMLPKTDPRLYELFEVGLGSIATLAASLNTRRFMPELLGMNLAIEATGVGGVYIESWKSASGPHARWKALAARLHNSIDNYADGHTKWSLSAVQSFMRRVDRAAPDETQAQWRRIWRLWRCQDILTHGTPGERAALAEYFDITTLAPF